MIMSGGRLVACFMPSGALTEDGLERDAGKGKVRRTVRPMATSDDHPDGTGLVTPATKVRNSEMNRANGGKAARREQGDDGERCR